MYMWGVHLHAHAAYASICNSKDLFIIIILFYKERKKERKHDKNVKKQSDDMLNNEKIQIKMERSPFHKTRNMSAPRGSNTVMAQVSNDLYDDFMIFAKQYNEEHNIAKSTKQTPSNTS